MEIKSKFQKRLEEVIEYNQFRQMTPTAIELWNDKKFLEKRIDEQWDYLTKLMFNNELSDRRKTELYWSAHSVVQRFKKRLEEIIQ